MLARATFLLRVIATSTFTLTLAAATHARAQDDTAPPAQPPPNVVIQPSAPLGPPPLGVVAPPDEAARDMARLGDVLAGPADDAHSYRMWSGAVGLGMGALLVPTGIFVLDKGSTSTFSGSSTTSVGGAIILGVGIGSILGGALNLALVSNPFERLHNAFEERKLSGKPAAVVVAETEAEWRDKVETMRTLRKVFGGVAIGIGGLSLVTGAVFAFASPPIGDLSRNEQYGFAAGFLAVGSVTVLAGIQAFFFHDSFESSYETYVRTKGGSRGAWLKPTFGVAPVAGGSVFTLGSTF